MAEDVASRVAGAGALAPELRERVERAAARLGSIHERWSRAEPGIDPAEGGGSSAEADALPLVRDAVSVTPILGIDTDESDEAGRPRFKTLMGVPRSSPELDELAGLDGSSGTHETFPIEHRRSPSIRASSERASPRVDEAPSLAGTSLPWEAGAPPSSRPRVASPWPSLAQSSLDVSAEVAALRTASRRRWMGLGTLAAAAALCAIVAPRQRTQALRWMESEYRAQLQPKADALSDTARALRPVASADTSPTSTSERATAQLELAVAAPRAAAEPAAAPSGGREMTPTVAEAGHAIAEDSSAAAAGAKLPNDGLPRGVVASDSASREPVQNAQLSAKPAVRGDESSAKKSKSGARDARSAGTTSKARAQVAAPRKPSQRGNNQQTASATDVAVRATKARATRQNTPRKESGSGIIRETPF